MIADHDAVAEPSFPQPQHPEPPIGLITLGAAIGVELMLLVLLRWGRLPQPTNLDIFTDRIRGVIAPERDLKIFAAAIICTLAAIAGFAWLANRWQWLARLRRSNITNCVLALVGFGGFCWVLPFVAALDVNDQRIVTHFGPLLLAMLPPMVITLLAVTPISATVVERSAPLLPAIALAISLAVLFVQMTANGIVGIAVLVAAGLWTIRCDRRANLHGKTINWRSLLASTCAAAVGSLALFYLIEGSTTFALWSRWRWCVPACAVALMWCTDLWQESDPLALPPWIEAAAFKSVRVLFVLFVLAILYLPRHLWPGLAGSFFRHDELHHWNFFAFGPAFAFAHHAALGSAVYSQYGCGWPMLFASLHRIVPLTYANVIGVASWIGIAYFVLLFVFLHLLLRNTGWAMAGTIGAILLQIFSGTSAGYLLWEYPSSTMLRHPVDVCCFLALLAFTRLKHPAWFLLAAMLTGVAAVMELDTGIYLAVTMAFFWLLQVARQWRTRPINFQRHVVTLTIAGSMIAMVTWLVGIGLAAHGHLLQRIFWSGYFEGMRIQAFSGMGLLPIADVPMDTLVPFGAMTLLYLISIAWGSWNAVVKQGLATRSMFLAAISVYGLGIMLLFVGRSHPWNLLHVTVPLAMVIAIAGSMLSQSGKRLRKGSSMGLCFAGCLIALLMTKPEFDDYPNLFNSNAIFMRQKIAMSNKPLDLAGFKNADRGEVRSFQAIAKTIHDLPVPDRQILVLDERDTLINYLANRAPWTRYTSLFHSLLAWDQVRDLQTQIRIRRPMYIVMRHEKTAIAVFNDLWITLHTTVARYYKFSRAAGDYELWQAKKSK